MVTDPYFTLPTQSTVRRGTRSRIIFPEITVKEHNLRTDRKQHAWITDIPERTHIHTQLLFQQVCYRKRRMRAVCMKGKQQVASECNMQSSCSETHCTRLTRVYRPERLLETLERSKHLHETVMRSCHHLETSSLSTTCPCCC